MWIPEVMMFGWFKSSIFKKVAPVALLAGAGVGRAAGDHLLD
jgi:hypothetical protein